MKNSFLRILCLSFFICGLVACASVRPPTSEELASANYGPYPENYKQIIETKIKQILVDEDSARFRFNSVPVKVWHDFTSGRAYAWGVCFEVNGKNRMGGYVGYRPYYMIIQNGRSLYMHEPLCLSGGHCTNYYCS